MSMKVSVTGWISIFTTFGCTIVPIKPLCFGCFSVCVQYCKGTCSNWDQIYHMAYMRIRHWWIILYEGDIITYFRALAAGYIPLWANYFTRWMPVANWGPQNLRDTPRRQLLKSASEPLVHNPSVIHGLAPAEWYHTLVTTASPFWTGPILHWAVYTCHYINSSFEGFKYPSVLYIDD